MAFASLELGVADQGIGRDGEDQVVDRRLAAPVVRVRLVTDDRVLLVLHELEGTGADGLQVHLLGRARLCHLVGVLRRMDGREVHAEVGDHRRFGLIEDEADRVVIYLVDALQQVRHVHAVEVLVAAAGDLVVGVALVELAVEAEHDVVRVEVAARLEVPGGVELDAPAQAEGVDEPVVRDAPRFGQRRYDLGAAALELDEAVVDVARRGVERGARCIERRGEALGAALGAVDQGLGRGRRGQRQRRRGQQAGKEFRSHRDLPPLDFVVGRRRCPAHVPFPEALVRDPTERRRESQRGRHEAGRRPGPAR